MLDLTNSQPNTLSADKVRFLALSELMTYNSFILVLWEADTLNVNYVSGNMGFLGIKPKKVRHMNDWESMVHPGDRDDFRDRRQCLSDQDMNVDFWHEYRVVNAAGEVRWINERLSFFSAHGARIYRSMMIDTTTRRGEKNTSAGSADSGSLHILDVVSREYLQQLSDTVSGILGVSSYIIDPSGEGLTEPSGTCELCRLIRESDRGATLCKLSDINISIEARDANALVAAPCETIGLYNAAVPIIAGGRHLATWMLGRVRAGGVVGDENIAALSRQLQIDGRAALESFRSMPEHDIDEITRHFALVNPYLRDLAEFIEHNILMTQETEKLIKSQEFLTKSADMDALQGRMYEVFYDMRSSGDISRFQDVFHEICEFFGFRRASVISLNGGRPDYLYKWSDVSDEGISDEFHALIPLCEGSPKAVLADRSQLPAGWGKILDAIGADHFYIYSVEVNNRPVGLVSFAQSTGRPSLNAGDVSFLSRLMRTVGSYVIMKRMERRMKENSDSLHSVLNNLKDCVYVVDRNSYELLFANRNFDGGDVPGPCGIACYRMLGQNGPCSCCGLEVLKSMPEGSSYTYETNERNAGFYHSVTMTAMHWLGERPAYLICSRDVTEEKLRHKQYLNASTFDASLGIPNYGRLTARLNNLIGTAGARGYLFIIDIDNIKLINNAYGHEYGVALLTEITAFFRSLPHGEEYHLYRHGPKSLAVIFENCGKEQADEFIGTLYERFDRQWNILEKTCYSTFSAVMTEYSHGDSSAERLIGDTNAMLDPRLGHNHGFNNVLELKKGAGEDYEHDLELANDLHEMVKNGCKELVVHYQPVHDLSSNSITHFEALMRWNHPTKGIIPPLEFIKIAEQTALIGILSENLISVAAAKCAEWKKTAPWIKISVNFSPTHSRHVDVVKNISAILENNYLQPSDLIIEVNESATGTDWYLTGFMTKMRELGCLVALDNFGTGMSAIGNLEKTPLDIINVDRCFVTDIVNDEYDRTVVGFMVKAGETLNLKIVCHGVETPEQLKELRALGVNFIQGYLVSKPMPAEDVPGFLRKEYILRCVN